MNLTLAEATQLTQARWREAAEALIQYSHAKEARDKTTAAHQEALKELKKLSDARAAEEEANLLSLT